MSLPSAGAIFGLGGLSAETKRGLVIAYGTSIAVVMGVNLIYPVLPPMMGQLGVDESAIGLTISVYPLPALFLAPLAGAIADLYGRRPLCFWGMLVFGLAGAGIGLAPSFGWVLVLRVVQSVGASALMPLTIVLLSDLVGGEQESSAQGFKSPLQKSVLTRNAPADMRGGVIAIDRLTQQMAKSAGPAAMGTLLLVTDMGTLFWVLAAFSLGSVALAGGLVAAWGRVARPVLS